MYNKLDIYRKILNLRDINEIIAMFDNSEYLDFEYDKYLYNPDIKKIYLSEKAVVKNVSRELEMAFIRDRYNVFYDLYNNLFQNTLYYTSQTYTLTDGDIVNLSGLVIEGDNGDYKVDVAPGPIITLTDKNDLDVELTDFTGRALLTVGDYTYTMTGITFSSPSTTITLLDDDLDSTMYDYTIESDNDKETRLVATKDYRELFLRYIPKLEVFKGTLKYIEFVMKYYYLIKYWDIDSSADINLTYTDSATTVVIGDNLINFVYYITSLVPIADWDLYIKKCVHPHGWIDTYYETVPSDNMLQKEFNSLENKPTYIDVLLSNNDDILRSVSTVKKFGNLNTSNDYISLGVDTGTLTMAGSFKSYDFDYYDTSNEKVEIYTDNYTIPPPQYSFDGYTYDVNDVIDGTKLKCLFTLSDALVGTNIIQNNSCYHNGDLPIDNVLTQDLTDAEFDVLGTGLMSDINDIDDNKYYYSTTTLPGVITIFENSNGYSHVCIQTMVWEDATYTTILGRSDIVTFEIATTESSNPIPNPNPETPEPTEPTPK